MTAWNDAFSRQFSRLFRTENEEDFDFIDPTILQQFQRTGISIEKIQKEIFNFDDKGGK